MRRKPYEFIVGRHARERGGIARVIARRIVDRPDDRALLQAEEVAVALA
jgi:hypothetical protein